LFVVVNNAGKELAAMRRIITHICPVCSNEFEGIVKAKFCSNKCKQKDKYRRLKEKRGID